jgi:O-antigen/teichoic acid export membrane protein
MRDDDRPGATRRLANSFGRTLQLPIYRSSYAQMLTTGANAVLGLLFWVIAARLYPADVVGLGAGGISALQLVAAIGWVGLQFTLLRYVPVAGIKRRHLVGLVYGAGVAMALAVAIAFTFALATDLNVPYVAGDALSKAMFWVSVVVWTVFSLQDPVLIGIRRAFLVPIENTTYGLIKLVLLVALSAIDDPWTLLGIWVGGSAVLVAAVNGLLFRRLLEQDRTKQRLPPVSRIARFSVGHTAVALTAWVPDFLVPLLVLRYLDQAANAYYYAAWTIGLSSRLLATNIANAMTVEGAYGERSIKALLRPVIHLVVTVLLPVMGILLLGAGVILQAFGPRYAEEGATLLRLFAISLLPYTVATLVIAFDRVRERFGAALIIVVVGTFTTIGLDMLLIPAHGISGAGLGWLGGQLAAAATALVTSTRNPAWDDAPASGSPGEPAPSPWP